MLSSVILKMCNSLYMQVVEILGDRDPLYEDYDKLTLCAGVMKEVSLLVP